MKNIQVIDSAVNCTYSIYQATDDEFEIIFPIIGQDIQFNDELNDTRDVEQALERVWKRPVLKDKVCGIHGTLFYDMPETKKEYPASRRYIDIDERHINIYERELLKAQK